MAKQQWINNKILSIQHDTNEHNEAAIYETQSNDKNSVRKEMSKLKNDMQEIKEDLKSLSDNQSMNKKYLTNREKRN